VNPETPRPCQQKDDRNINETGAKSHQRLWGFNWGEVVDFHHLWFHFAAVLVTFPANGRPSDPARRPREQKDDRDNNETAAKAHQRFWGFNGGWGYCFPPSLVPFCGSFGNVPGRTATGDPQTLP
jgi:hypothetical protein